MDFFNELRDSMGPMLSDEQKADLKQMGEQFYASIDMDKYQPRLADDTHRELLPDQDAVDHIRYLQLQRALESGLREDDLSDDERDLLSRYT